jgi:hypothetical protein
MIEKIQTVVPASVFQDRRFQPLTHSSVSNYNLHQHLVGFLVTLLMVNAAFGATAMKLSQGFMTAAFFESGFVCVSRSVTETMLVVRIRLLEVGRRQHACGRRE